MIRLRQVGIGLVTIALAAASCSNDPESGRDGSADPVFVVLGFGETSDEIATSVYQARILQEEAIADCMLARGFEYILPPIERPEPLDFVVDDGNSRRSEDGYGFAVDPEQYLRSFVDLEHDNDPNSEIVRQLSPVELAAYNEAFVGPDGSGGCAEEALVKTNAAYRFSLEFSTDIANVASDVRQDSRVVSEAIEWSRCMNNQGFDFSFPDEPVSDFESSLQEWFSTHAPTAHITQTGEAVIDFDEEGRAALAELASLERSTAAADDQCSEQYWATVATVKSEITSEMLARNRDRVEQVLAG